MIPNESGRTREEDKWGDVGEGMEVLDNLGDWIRITFSIGTADANDAADDADAETDTDDTADAGADAAP